tara:strand:- start:1633 stop:2016 length:384 start_codon:yes stop_codon:yes gene_type:complete
MTTIANLLITPVVSLNHRIRHRLASSALDAPPPPVDTTKQWDFGRYCWKVVVESKDKESGKLDKTFVGYSQNMNIADRTKGACDRHKKSGTICGEPELIMKGGECDEVIFMKKTPDGPLIRISNLFF